MALAKNCHNKQFYRNQILMQPIKMTTQHAPRRAYLFSFGGTKARCPREILIFWDFVFPMFHVCLHKVLSDIPHMCSTSSQCVNPNMFPIAPHIKRYVLPKIELS